MAKPKLKRKDSGGKGPKGSSGPKNTRLDNKGREAIRGMLLGAVLIGVVAAFFMLPVKGKTTFTHLLQTLGLQGNEASAPEAKTPDAAKPQGRKQTRPEGVKVAARLRDAPPLDRTHPEDDAALDALAKKTTGHRIR
jgi:hypothetical protein